MKKILIFLISIVVVVGIVCYQRQLLAVSNVTEIVKDTIESIDKPDKTINHLRKKSVEAKAYCHSKGFSEEYCVLVNFHIHSGKNRFFVWDFARDTVLYVSLCAHGSGLGSTASKPEYSNVEGSYCSSLGRYKIGVSSYSQYGINIHYKLHGQDATNNNAFKRIVVLHSYGPVPEREIYPVHLPLGYSLGCPVISDGIMRKMDALLKKSEKSVMLWIYDESLD
ncbi:MAG: murein L,D-transpeptidase catalytic domain family protein [Tannerella sp.]|jgi:uncharacterized protein YxeA|nr:murein L,D-transpeptidase catalytic domain family protein [Tannerella sp.]